MIHFKGRSGKGHAVACEFIGAFLSSSFGSFLQDVLELDLAICAISFVHRCVTKVDLQDQCSVGWDQAREASLDQLV